MNKDELKKALLELSKEERALLLQEVEKESGSYYTVIKNRRKKLDNKQGRCPHCGSYKYTKYGTDKGSKRYRCKECKRTFTEYTGTWLANIHKKELADEYIKLMREEKSLDKIRDHLKINKKTAFDWRHKILSGIEQSKEKPFQGITESDETFFLHSEKGVKHLTRPPRKRGGNAQKRGISNEQVAVIVTTDRVNNINMKVARMGRIKKSDIEKAIGDRVSEQTILCSDGHVSYKGFASDKGIEHHTIRSNVKEHVKNKIYHLQHVNSIDSRLKKWIESRFLGVSTKYLQKYLAWFGVKEELKESINFVEEFTDHSLEDTDTWKRFKAISENYKEFMQ